MPLEIGINPNSTWSLFVVGSAARILCTIDNVNPGKIEINKQKSTMNLRMRLPYNPFMKILQKEHIKTLVMKNNTVDVSFSP